MLSLWTDSGKTLYLSKLVEHFHDFSSSWHNKQHEVSRLTQPLSSVCVQQFYLTDLPLPVNSQGNLKSVMSCITSL